MVKSFDDSQGLQELDVLLAMLLGDLFGEGCHGVACKAKLSTIATRASICPDVGSNQWGGGKHAGAGP